MMTQASRIGIWGLIATAGALAAPRIASAQCRDYAVRRVYTSPVVVSYAAPAYPVVTYPVVTYPVYSEPVYVAQPVVTTYTRCYQPAVQVRVSRDYGHRSYSYHRSYSHHHRHRGWSANVRVDHHRRGRSVEFNVRRYRH